MMMTTPRVNPTPQPDTGASCVLTLPPGVGDTVVGSVWGAAQAGLELLAVYL